MKKIILSSILFYSISVLGACSSANNKTTPGEAPPPAAPPQQQMPTQEEMMAKWKEYSTPGDEHKVLNSMIGNWDYNVEFYMDPAAPPEKSKGKSTMRWIMGG